MRTPVAAVAVATLLAASAPAGAQVCPEVPTVDDRCESWTAMHGATTSGEQARSVAAAGGRVFVAGLRQTAAGWDMLTVAYDAAGAELWSRVHDGGNDDYAWAVAAAPDGSRVYVTGESTPGSGFDIVTLAYDGATGAPLWQVRHDAGHDDRGHAVTVSADGDRVYVLGGVGSAPSASASAIAYDAETGEKLWANGASIGGTATPAGIIEAGDRVIIAATAPAIGATDGDFIAAAFRVRDSVQGTAKAGDRLWSTTYTSGPGNEDRVYGIAASSDGGRVFLTGESGPGGSRPWATVALDAATGQRLWVSSYGTGSGLGGGWAEDLEVSPDGATVYAGGRVATVGQSTTLGQPGAAFAVVAYDAATGVERWSKIYDYPGRAEFAKELALSPDGATVYISGWSGFLHATIVRDLVTVAYDTTTSNQRWVARFNASAQGIDGQEPWGMVATPQGVFVGGSVLRPGTSAATGQYDLLTLAYPL